MLALTIFAAEFVIVEQASFSIYKMHPPNGYPPWQTAIE